MSFNVEFVSINYFFMFRHERKRRKKLFPAYGFLIYGFTNSFIYKLSNFFFFRYLHVSGIRRNFCCRLECNGATKLPIRTIFVLTLFLLHHVCSVDYSLIKMSAFLHRIQGKKNLEYDFSSLRKIGRLVKCFA